MVATKKNLFDVLRHEQPEMSRRFGIKRLAVFGSFARGVIRRDSDVDLLVELEKPLGLRFMEFSDHIEKKLGRKADILTMDGLKSIRIKGVVREIVRTCEYV